MPPITPPPLLPGHGPRSASPLLVTVLSLILFGFLASALVSLATCSLALLLNRPTATFADGPLFLVMLGVTVLAYGLMAVFPAIPKRIFLPLSLFFPVATAAILPLLVFFHERATLLAWGVAVLQILLGVLLVRWVQGGWRFRWPLFPEERLTRRRFSWGNFVGVALAGALLVLPALLLAVAFSVQLAVDHFTDGFVALRPSGLTMRVRNYLRDDGKKIMLVPMSHIGEAAFYYDLAASFPSDSVVLMEGVTNAQKVVNAPMDYSRAASAVGAVEQADAFRPPGELVAADVDMSAFSPATLDLLRNAILIHSKGVTAETLPILLKPTPPDLTRQLMDDILTKRNHHLLGVLREHLPRARQIIVPWGAAHLPEIAREIQRLGFRQVDQREYIAIRFGF